MLPGFCQRQKGFLLSARGPRRWCGCQSRASLIPAGQRDYHFISHVKSLYVCADIFAITDLFDVITCDRFTMAVHRSLCNNDDIQTGAAASLLSGTEKTFRINEQT